MEKEKIYNEHHPSRELFPDFTLRVPSWLHLVLRRMEQMNDTEQNFIDICNFTESADWIKKMMYARMYGGNNEDPLKET